MNLNEMTPGMRNHYQKFVQENPWHTCEDCGFKIGRYPGRYGRFCVHCGADVYQQETYPRRKSPESPVSKDTPIIVEFDFTDTQSLLRKLDELCGAMHTRSGLPRVESPSGKFVHLVAVNERTLVFAVYPPKVGGHIAGTIRFEAKNLTADALFAESIRVLKEFMAATPTSPTSAPTGYTAMPAGAGAKIEKDEEENVSKTVALAKDDDVGQIDQKMDKAPYTAQNEAIQMKLDTGSFGTERTLWVILPDGKKLNAGDPFWPGGMPVGKAEQLKMMQSRARETLAAHRAGNQKTEKLVPLPVDECDPFELEIGTSVEGEHTDDEAEASRIARQHLREDPHYYRKLYKASMFKDDEVGKKLAAAAKEEWGAVKESLFESINDAWWLIDGKVLHVGDSTTHKRYLAQHPKEFGATEEEAMACAEHGHSGITATTLYKEAMGRGYRVGMTMGSLYIESDLSSVDQKTFNLMKEFARTTGLAREAAKTKAVTGQEGVFRWELGGNAYGDISLRRFMGASSFGEVLHLRQYAMQEDLKEFASQLHPTRADELKHGDLLLGFEDAKGYTHHGEHIVWRTEKLSNGDIRITDSKGKQFTFPTDHKFHDVSFGPEHSEPKESIGSADGPANVSPAPMNPSTYNTQPKEAEDDTKEEDYVDDFGVTVPKTRTESDVYKLDNVSRDGKVQSVVVQGQVRGHVFQKETGSWYYNVLRNDRSYGKFSNADAAAQELLKQKLPESWEQEFRETLEKLPSDADWYSPDGGFSKIWLKSAAGVSFFWFLAGDIRRQNYPPGYSVPGIQISASNPKVKAVRLRFFGDYYNENLLIRADNPTYHGVQVGVKDKSREDDECKEKKEQIPVRIKFELEGKSYTGTMLRWGESETALMDVELEQDLYSKIDGKTFKKGTVIRIGKRNYTKLE